MMLLCQILGSQVLGRYIEYPNQRSQSLPEDLQTRTSGQMVEPVSGLDEDR